MSIFQHTSLEHFDCGLERVLSDRASFQGFGEDDRSRLDSEDQSTTGILGSTLRMHKSDPVLKITWT